MKISVFIATSLDRFIARQDGDIDWLMDVGDAEPGEDYGYKGFADTVDCMLMGRGSMEKVLSFPDWPYEGQRVIVLSNTLTTVPDALSGKIELYSGSLDDLVKRLESEGAKRLYIDGGKTIQSFLSQGLVTDMVITTIPVLLGEGLPLFGQIPQDIKLKHVSTTSYPNGLVQSSYEV